MKSALRTTFTCIAVASGVAVGMSSLVGFLGGLTWYLDLFSHFRVQYFAILAVLSVLLLPLRRPRVAACLMLLALANLLTILPFYFGDSNSARPRGDELRLVTLNVNTRRGDPALAVRMLEQLDADVIALQEVDQRWLDELQEVLLHYPYSKASVRNDNFGIAIYSRLPLNSAEIVALGNAGLPTVHAELQVSSGPLHILVTHPLPPTSARNWHERNEQLAAIAGFVRDLSDSVVVVGDLNITPWSPHFARLLSESGLHDSMRGFGVQPTWPAWLPLMLIPIDHCLHSDDVIITSRAVGFYVESDHLPVVVELQVERRRRAPESAGS